MKKVCHDRDEVSYGELHGIRWPLEVFNDFRRNRNVVFFDSTVTLSKRS